MARTFCCFCLGLALICHCSTPSEAELLVLKTLSDVLAMRAADEAAAAKRAADEAARAEQQEQLFGYESGKENESDPKPDNSDSDDDDGRAPSPISEEEGSEEEPLEEEFFEEK
jgi:hypothetical protein